MRSGFLILLAAALGVSAGPAYTKADAWGQCGNGTGTKSECPTGFQCVNVNDGMCSDFNRNLTAISIQFTIIFIPF